MKAILISGPHSNRTDSTKNTMIPLPQMMRHARELTKRTIQTLCSAAVILSIAYPLYAEELPQNVSSDAMLSFITSYVPPGWTASEAKSGSESEGEDGESIPCGWRKFEIGNPSGLCKITLLHYGFNKLGKKSHAMLNPATWYKDYPVVKKGTYLGLQYQVGIRGNHASTTVLIGESILEVSEEYASDVNPPAEFRQGDAEKLLSRYFRMIEVEKARRYRD